jgi:hypothetical protein
LSCFIQCEISMCSYLLVCWSGLVLHVVL